MKRILQFLLLTLIACGVSGCRAYVAGYRTYNESSLQELVSSQIEQQKYLFSSDESTVSFIRRDRMKNTYATKKYEVTEYVLRKNDAGLVVVKMIAFPALVICSPYMVVSNKYFRKSHIHHNGNAYVYSVGRQYLHFFNPFISFPGGTKIAGTETEKDLVDTVFEYKTSEEDELPQDLRLDVFDGQTHFSIENGTTVSELRKKVFQYAFPAQKRTVTVSKGNIKKVIELNSAHMADAQEQEEWTNIQSYSDEHYFCKEKDLLSKIEDLRSRSLLSEAGYTQIKEDIRRKSDKGKATFTSYEQEIETIRLAY